MPAIVEQSIRGLVSRANLSEVIGMRACMVFAEMEAKSALSFMYV
jgi:hypothetical protein